MSLLTDTTSLLTDTEAMSVSKTVKKGIIAAKFCRFVALEPAKAIEINPLDKTLGLAP